MPKIFSEEDIQTVWDAVHKKSMKRKQVCELLNCTPEEAEQLYAAARRRYGHTIKAKLVNHAISEGPQVSPFKRPKAVYSNHSPYGIAQPGMN